jgi:hypothetical protein
MVAVTMCGPAAIVEQPILEGKPAKAISYLKPIADWDSGYAVFGGEPGDDTDTALVCLHCLIEEHPELGRGLDLARQQGEAVHDERGWTAATAAVDV